MAYDLFPAVDEGYNFPPEVLDALARSPQLRSLVVPMSQTARNNLSGPDLWDGRVVVNTTTDRLNRYDLGTTSWKVVAEIIDTDALDTRLDAAEAALVIDDGRLDAHDGLLASLDTRMDAQETYTHARVRSTSAGVQDNGFGRKFLDTGLGGWRANPPVFVFGHNVSGTFERDGITVSGWAASDIVYITSSGVTLTDGLPILVTVID